MIALHFSGAGRSQQAHGQKGIDAANEQLLDSINLIDNGQLKNGYQEHVFMKLKSGA